MKLLNKTFLIRTLSAIALLCVVLGSVLSSRYGMVALLCLIAVGSILEFRRIALARGAEPLAVWPAVVGVSLVIGVFLASTGLLRAAWLSLLLPMFFALFVVELFRKKSDPGANIAWAVGGILYAALPMALLSTLPIEYELDGATTYRPLNLLIILFIVWANDIGAYIFGVLCGRHKLCERISPNKSWEGFVGGVLCAMATSIGIGVWQGMPVGLMGGLGLVVALSGVAGDLIESMFKRSAGVKDSGNILPGHGGFLDRFDALIVAVPFVYAYITICTVLLSLHS